MRFGTEKRISESQGDKMGMKIWAPAEATGRDVNQLATELETKKIPPIPPSGSKMFLPFKPPAEALCYSLL